jgi:hypothetical protein
LQEALVEQANVAREAKRIAITMTYATWAPPAVAIVRGVQDDDSMRAALDGFHLVLVSDDHLDAAKKLGVRAAVVPALQKLEADGTVATENVLTGAAWGENVPAEMAPKIAAWADRLRAAVPLVAATPKRPDRVDPAGTAGTPAPAGMPAWQGVLLVVLGLGLLVAAATWKVMGDASDKRDRNEEIRKRAEKDAHDAATKALKKPVPPT